jgi:predicted amidohydrolase
MRDIRIGVAQFEARDADKDYNFGRIESLARQAAEQDAEIVSIS